MVWSRFSRSGSRRTTAREMNFASIHPASSTTSAITADQTLDSSQAVETPKIVVLVMENATKLLFCLK